MTHDTVVTGSRVVAAKVLTFGSGYDSPRGSQPVRALQRRLARAGEKPGPIDGRYGPLTERAVRRFQADHGLEVDGIAGPQTWATLSSPTTVLYPGAGSQELGGSGPVRALQRRLARAGEKPGPIDGRYGSLTERAVRRFQAAHGLHVDGIAGVQMFVELDRRAHSHRLGSGPHAASPRPVRIPAAIKSRPRHPTGWPSPGLLALLVVLGVVMLGSVALRVRHRRHHRSTALRETGHIRNQTAGLEPEARPGSAPTVLNGLNAASPLSNRPDASDNANAAFDRGALLEGEGDLAGAEAAYRRADHLGHAAAACNLGVLLEEQGDLTGAEAAYRRADDRGDPNAAFDLGGLLEDQGDLVGAQAAYRRAEQSSNADVATVARAALLGLSVAITASTGGYGGDLDVP